MLESVGVFVTGFAILAALVLFLFAPLVLYFIYSGVRETNHQLELIRYDLAQIAARHSQPLASDQVQSPTFHVG